MHVLFYWDLPPCQSSFLPNGVNFCPSAESLPQNTVFAHQKIRDLEYSLRELSLLIFAKVRKGLFEVSKQFPYDHPSSLTLVYTLRQGMGVPLRVML